MCGICGELRFDQLPANPADLTAMLQTLQRRGPDNEGVFHQGPAALGHRRLSIIDLSERSNQPLLDQSAGLALVFNGTIYNYPMLRQQLQSRGHHFVSSGDTEVILRAYQEWGQDCVERLHGMFAFAIWDNKRHQLFLARDRLGIKPLYYAENRQGFRFASNTQALLAAGGIDTEIDPIALHHQFSLHAVIPAPRTILTGVRKLAPGTTMTITTDGHQQHRSYWQLQARRPEKALSEWEWIEQIHESLKRAVEKRKTIADVPVGVLLSGGLDSSLLVALLAEAGVKDLLTFSVGFEDSPEESGSEFEYSDQVVSMYGTEHHKFHIPNSEVLRRLPEAVMNMAEPMVGQDAVAFYLLAEQVSQHVKVVQSGQGADEVFAGYFWYAQMQQASGTDLERFRNHYFDRDHDEYLEMVQPAYHGPDYTSGLVETLLGKPGADTFMDKILRLDVTTLIVDDPVKRVDNMTMAWGLEARVPFLDHELVELAAQMPAEIKMKNGGKYPLKSIARGLLPDAVIDRPKGYFPVPALKFVRGEFLEFMKSVLLSDNCRRRALYQTAYLDKLLKEPEKYLTRIQGNKLWHMALLEFWLQQNVDSH
jgi:asparagine synthase (glutamine-hydrolysing)